MVVFVTVKARTLFYLLWKGIEMSEETAQEGFKRCVGVVLRDVVQW